ncbi:MAG TPA: hypothetical protein VKX49_25300 [Bryobacteraceae bacterium]|nr:hypothetical protein [Bryobacteraceae bacterium]
MAILACKALPHGVLTSAYIVEERCWSIRNIAFRAPTHIKGIIVAAALMILNGDHRSVVVAPAGILRQADMAAAGDLADLKITDGVKREWLAALAAFIAALRTLERIHPDPVSAQAYFSAIVDPDSNLAMTFALSRVPSWQLARP